ncbi:SGNH/GDSL hydrolase family protein [Galbibacter pacificus]|uniref:SGNH hydrolase-type esterase domain-containing protein n=1 Tax=Galbibacter pacificus TaxID=2996052 RepID=A0ABT6FMQ0_9FLAO|nr:hypothetical protein [Galbibacter pacificus]MDG3581061.1 hypothetical protein [Galbibacter pacificus]MDG3584539.1 hypothetical protein [Galbibacter pacificus]
MELILRLFHYGYNPDLFIPYDQEGDYLIFNPEASKKYFSDISYATQGNREPFKREKPFGTYRIFVLGESTTLGYPYFHNGSFHRWLEYRFMKDYPEKDIEIINLSLTAVNTYTIAGFAKRLSSYKPDAVLIYVGHNEYYGAMGIASTQTIGANPILVQSVIYLRKFKVAQLISNTLTALRGLWNEEPDSESSRMALMVNSDNISFDSILYKKGLYQFEYNLNRTLRQFSKEGIPVYIGNLVCNEKDLPPFESHISDDTDKKFMPLFEQGVEAIRLKDTLTAFQYLSKANSVYSRHALCNYYMGTLFYQKRLYDSAASYFSKAIDFDGLKFRAPGSFNEIIETLASRYEGVYLVDCDQLFRRASIHNIPGDNLFTDHVHPNLRGYALMSDAYFRKLKESDEFSFMVRKGISLKELYREMPITALDSLCGKYRIQHLKASWPYKNDYKCKLKITLPEEEISQKVVSHKLNWLKANQDLYMYYVQNNKLYNASKVAESMVLEFPKDPVFSKKAAQVYGQINIPKKAFFYMERSFKQHSSLDKARFLLVYALKLDDPKTALSYINYIGLNGRFERNRITQLIKTTREIIKLKDTIEKASQPIPIWLDIADKYKLLNTNEMAMVYLKKVLEVDQDNKAAQKLLANIKKNIVKG